MTTANNAASLTINDGPPVSAAVTSTSTIPTPPTCDASETVAQLIEKIQASLANATAKKVIFYVASHLQVAGKVVEDAEKKMSGLLEALKSNTLSPAIVDSTSKIFTGIILCHICILHALSRVGLCFFVSNIL